MIRAICTRPFCAGLYRLATFSSHALRSRARPLPLVYSASNRSTLLKFLLQPGPITHSFRQLRRFLLQSNCVFLLYNISCGTLASFKFCKERIVQLNETDGVALFRPYPTFAQALNSCRPRPLLYCFGSTYTPLLPTTRRA